MIIKEKERVYFILGSFSFERNQKRVYMLKLVNSYGEFRNVMVSKDVFDSTNGLVGKKIIIKEIYELED